MASYEKHGNTWRYIVSYTDNGKRKRISKSGFTKKSEAIEAAREVERTLSMGSTINAKKVLLSDYFEDWVKVFKLKKRATATEKNYQTTLNIIEAYMPDVMLGDLNRKRYQEFINDYSKTKSKETVRKVHVQIRACIRHAINEGDILRDPTYQIELGGKDGKAKELKFLSLEETQKLIDALLKDIKPNQTSRFMILTGLSTGLRYGEMAGLTNADVDLKNDSLTVNKSWDYKFTNDFSKTKTELSERTVSIDENTVKLLKWYRKAKQEHALKSGYRNPHDLFFTNNMHRPLNIAGVNKALMLACQRAGVTRITFHGLRHTHASMLLYQGMDIHYISQRLGHSSVTTTSDVYAHIIKEAKKQQDQETSAQIQQLYSWGQFGD